MVRFTRFRPVSVAFLLGTALAIFIVAPSAFAHGHTQVGDYQLVIGFHNEPAYVDEPNGLDLFVTNMKTNQPVNGLADSLHAEIIYGASSKPLTVKAQYGKNGAYTAYVLPTEVGPYTWHITGSIKGTTVDVKMASSPETFSSVEAKSLISFPGTEPTAAAMADQVAAANRMATIALVVGVIGGLLGVAGIAVAVMSQRGLLGVRQPTSAERAQSTPAPQS